MGENGENQVFFHQKSYNFLMVFKLPKRLLNPKDRNFTSFHTCLVSGDELQFGLFPRCSSSVNQLAVNCWINSKNCGENKIYIVYIVFFLSAERLHTRTCGKSNLISGVHDQAFGFKSYGELTFEPSLGVL